MHDDLSQLLTQLSRSPFRSRFSLRGKDRAYLETKDQTLVLDHAADFIAKRLAPAVPANDGK